MVAAVDVDAVWRGEPHGQQEEDALGGAAAAVHHVPVEQELVARGRRA